MVDTSKAIGQGAELVMQQLYQALLGPGVNNLRQGKPATATEFGQSAATIGLNALPLGGAGVAKGAKGINPQGLRALAETMALTRRSFNPANTRYGAQATRPVQDVASRTFGPGSYFAPNKAGNYTTWLADYGTYLKRPNISPKAALDIAKSKGYYNLDEAADPAILQGTTFDNPVVQGLRSEGYIGAKSPSHKAVTSWLVGETPGMSTRTVGQLDQQSRWVNPTAIQKIANKVREQSVKKGDIPFFDQSRMTTAQLAKKAAINKAKSITSKLKAEEPPMQSPRG